MDCVSVSDLERCWVPRHPLVRTSAVCVGQLIVCLCLCIFELILCWYANTNQFEIDRLVLSHSFSLLAHTGGLLMIGGWVLLGLAGQKEKQ